MRAVFAAAIAAAEVALPVRVAGENVPPAVAAPRAAAAEAAPLGPPAAGPALSGSAEASPPVATGAAPAAGGATLEVADLVDRLDFPRGDLAGQARAREVLVAALDARGIAVQEHGFAWRRRRAFWAGILWLVAALLIFAGSVRGGDVARVVVVVAAALAVLGTVVLAGGLDRLLAVSPAANLEVVIEPRGDVQHEVLLGAHYDSKTELFDHVERTAWMVCVVALAGGALAIARSRPREARILGTLTAFGVAMLGVHFTSGSWLAARGHGVLDDAAACAVVAAEAARLHVAPLEHTRVRCIWWAGEETGAQGSRSDVCASRALPDAVVNLECIGAGPRPGYAQLEWTGRGFARADARLVASLEAAGGRRLVPIRYPVVTDGGSWRRRGVSAVTLLDLPQRGWVPRHLHGPGDRREALDVRALEATQELLGRWLTAIDANPPAGLRHAAAPLESGPGWAAR